MPKSVIAKSLAGLGQAILEIAQFLRQRISRGLCSEIGEALWVVHPFQKKFTPGVKTPQHEIDLTKGRLTRLKKMSR